MKKMVLLLVFVFISGAVVSHEYSRSLSCWEQTMCHQPEEYSDVDFQDEVVVPAQDELWNGTIEIRNVTFTHNISEEITNTRFQTIYDDSGRERTEEKRVIFDGVIQTESLCNEPVFEVDILKSSKYTINVYENDTYGVRSCNDHPVKVDYTLTLDTSTSNMEVVVNQSNITESFQTEDYSGLPRGPGNQVRFEDDKEEENREEPSEGIHQENGGLLDGAIGIFSSYFGVFTDYF